MPDQQSVAIGAYNIPHNPWTHRAACTQTDPNLWSPGPGQSNKRAKRICWGTCPVRADCLQHALDHREPFGVWGGYTHKERRRLQRGEPPFQDGDHGYDGYRHGCRCNICLDGAAHRDDPTAKPGRICEHCDGPVHGQGRQRYCSADCRAAARPTPDQHRQCCGHCGEMFLAIRAAQYCTSNCRAKACKARARARKAAA